MRKSTVMIMAILMLCFGTLLVAASVLSKPMKQDAMMGKELTKLLTYQEVIEKGTKVSVVRRPASKHKTLATEGRGVVVRLSPAKAVRKKNGGVNAILRRIVSQISDGYAGSRVDWIEFHLSLDDRPQAKPVRTLVRRSASGGFLPPNPKV